LKVSSFLCDNYVDQIIFECVLLIEGSYIVINEP